MGKWSGGGQERDRAEFDSHFALWQPAEAVMWVVHIELRYLEVLQPLKRGQGPSTRNNEKQPVSLLMMAPLDFGALL